MYFIEARKSKEHGKYWLVYKNEKKATSRDVAFFLSQDDAIEYLELKNGSTKEK
jgi:hypothetical protein